MAMGVTGVRWHAESRCSRVRIGRVARRRRQGCCEREIVESWPKCRQTRMRLEARTMRQVTLRIVPFLMVCYFISFLDRVNLGFAALQMVEDLHFSATVFGFGAGIFFVSYFLFEVPSNLLLEKFGARRWIARIMITWGVLAGAMALVTGPRSLYLVRFLLGAAEAGFFPGVILYLTYWFPAEYRARIVGLFMVAIPVSSFLGSPISAALLGTDGWLGLRGWQWMFILEAAPAVLFGLACLFVLSDRPADARWLEADERRWLLAKTPGASRPAAPGGTVEPPAGAVEQARAGAQRRPGGKHGGEQRASALAASDHQVVRPDEHADRACSTPFRSRSRPSS